VNITSIKTTKITRFSNQNKNNDRPNSKLKSLNKKKKTKTQHVRTRIQQKNYCKKEIKQNYDKKMYSKLLLNKLKIMGNPTSIYTCWAFSSRKFS